MQNEVIPAAIPGVVFGLLALIGCFVVIGWIIYKYCHCCCCACCSALCPWASRWRRKQHGAADTLLIHNPLYRVSTKLMDEDAPVTVEVKDIPPEIAAIADYKSHKAEIGDRAQVQERWAHVLQWLVAFLAVLTAIMGIWAIPETLIQTSTQIDSFWSLLDDIRGAQAETSKELVILSDHLFTFRSSVRQISTESNKLEALLRSLGETGATIADGLDILDEAANREPVVLRALESAITALDNYIGNVSSYLIVIGFSYISCLILVSLQSITKITNSLQPPTLAFENQYRVIIIVVSLGIIVFCTIVIGVLSWNLKHPAAVSSFAAVMLFFVFLVLLVGSGVVKSGQTLSDDACLYTENFAATRLIDNMDDLKERKFWHIVLSFYLHPEPPPPDAQYSALSEITRANISGIFNLLQTPNVTKLLDLVSSADAQNALIKKLEPATVEAINNLTNLIQPLFQTGTYWIFY